MTATKTDPFTDFLSPPRVCRLATIIAELDSDHSAAVLKALETPSIGVGKIAQVITGWGYRVSDKTVGPHRNGSCVCYR